MSTYDENIPKQENNIYESLHKKGILNDIRAYLHSSIAQSIQGEKITSYSNTVSQFKSNNLIRKTLNNGDYDRMKVYKIICSLIKDFFKKTDLNYSFPVFNSECGFSDLLTEEELSKQLNINYSNLESCGEENFLAYIIKQLLNGKEKKTISTQASESDFIGCHSENLENSKFKGLSSAKSIEAKFKEVDEKYYKLTFLENRTNSNNIFDSLMPAKALEEKMLKYQRECEAKYKSELDREILRLKEIEISNIRIEENKRYLKKIEEVRNEYEEEYGQRYENLKKRETDFNIKIANKEKELELIQYETRQKYLNQIEALKIKQDEIKLKYENDLNLLSFKQEKLNFKEKDLENLRENCNRKISEEVESFKVDYIKNFEFEKGEIHQKKLKVEELEFKSNLRNEQYLKLENENKLLNEEVKILKKEIKSLEESNKEYKNDLQSLREELKILSSNEKRNYDQFNIKSTENESLRTENKILKENILNLKQMNDDRKSDQGAIIEDYKIQIRENTKQFNKIKEELENENLKLRKDITELLEKMKNLKNNKNKSKDDDSFNDLHHTKNIIYQKQLINAQKDLRKPIVKYEYNFDYLNLNQDKINPNNINNFFRENSKNNNKILDNITKLEKESDELKQEIKNNFVNRPSLTDQQTNSSPVLNDYNLWNLQNQVSNTANLEKSIVNALFEKIKDANMFKNINNQNSTSANKMEEKLRHKDSIHAKNQRSLNNISNSNEHNISFEGSSKPEKYNLQPIKDNPILNNKDSKNSAESLEKKNSKKSRNENQNENDEFISVDKLHQTPVFNKENINIYRQIKKENNIMSASQLNDANEDKNSSDRNREIEKLQNELEKIKNDHNQSINKNLSEKHLRNGSKNSNNINIIDNYNTNQFNIKSNRDSENNEFSVGNITSSMEWELETNRKDKNEKNPTNNFNTKQESPSVNVNHNPLNSKSGNQKNILANNSNSNKLIKLKDLKDKINQNAFENSTKIINSIKEESDELEKENVSSFDENNNKNPINKMNSKEQKENKVINIKNPMNLGNSSQKTPVNNINKSISNIYNTTNKSNSYQDFENTENLEGLNLKNSFNKFSNVNFDYDNKDNEDEIKSENPSENYGDDFIEDVDNIDNKNHKTSFDLDAIKNVSNNFTNNSYIGKDNLKINTTINKMKDRNKGNNTNINNYHNNLSNSNDNKTDKFLQSKNSLNDENGIEEVISINTSSKRDKVANSGKSIIIDEDSYLKNNRESAMSNEYKYNYSENMIKSNIEDSNNNYNDFNYNLSNNFSGSNTLKNILNSKEKDSSNRENVNVQKLYESRNSEIKEEIFDEDDGYEPINYD